MQPPKQATLTGKTVTHPAGTLHEVVCVSPECRAEQYHRAGNVRCILCGEPFSVQPIHLVPPVNLPEQPKETPCLENEEKENP